MLQSIFGEDLFDDFWRFPGFREAEKQLYGKHAPHVMKTDVREHEDRYELEIDLPGFKKEELDLKLEKGCLTVTAAKGVDKDETDKKGRLIRQERYAGSVQRSFWVGEDVTEEDIKARFEDGVLTLTVPKRETKKLPECRTITIE